MILPVDKAGEALAAWVDAELVTKASGLQKLATVMATIAIARRGEAIVAEYASILSMLGITDSTGGIDIDAARELAMQAFERTGKITAFGVILGPQDVESIYETAKKYAQ